MKNVFFSGINGIGMSALALILKAQGIDVSGSDLEYKNISRTMEEKGIKIYIGQKLENVENKNIDTYIYSTAIKKNNPEYMYMKKNNVKMFHRGELLANIMNKFKLSIAAAGTHGKTTTSSLASTLFLEKDPYIAVGGIIPEIESNSRVGSSEYFIAEADESDNSFLHMFPYYSIITNIEEDHLEFHGNIDNIISSFKKFITQTQKNVLACYDDEILSKFNDEKIIYYSVNEENKDKVKIYARNIYIENSKTYFEVVKNGENLGKFSLSIPGLHNISNSLPVIYIATEENIDLEYIKKSLDNFKGANRRYQIIYNKEFKIIDDYAHHPTEIEATIKAAKLNEKKEIIVIFEPHRYTRTKFFLNDFSKSLSLADKTIILPIYSANEDNEYGITSLDLSKNMTNDNEVMEKKEFINYFLNENKKDKVFIFMGAGSISSFAHEIVGKL